MEILSLLLTELEQEAKVTRKMLALVPVEKSEWAPHEKSMKMGPLAAHIAELPQWITMALETEGLDFAANPYDAPQVESNVELLAFFEKSYNSGVNSLTNAKPEVLNGRWVLRNGDTILSDSTKYQTIRMALAQIIHHRAQLGVYLRLLNIPIPGSYGPSADDMTF
jgi:uncharacterized damage-inducible protein DinB